MVVSSAFIPVNGYAAANTAASAKVKADKDREVRNGHDGTWVAHPGLVPVAMEAFAALDLCGDRSEASQIVYARTQIPGRKESSYGAGDAACGPPHDPPSHAKQ